MSYGNGYLQDIHIDDITTWKDLQNDWKLEDYASILNTLNPNNHLELISKYVSAAYLNNLTARLYLRETDIDPDFVKDRIQVSRTPPSLLNGEVYFQDETDEATILSLNLTSDLTQNLYFTHLNSKKGEW